MEPQQPDENTFFFSADILALKVQIFPHEHHLLDQAVPRGWCWFDEAIS